MPSDPTEISVRTAWRPELSAPALSMVVGAVLLAGYNATWWGKGQDLFDGAPLTFAVFVTVVYALMIAFFALFSWRHVVRPAMALLLIGTAVTSYYTDTLGVMIDRDMIQNAATTTFTEGRHLLTPRFLLHLALFGLLPAGLLFFVRVRRLGWGATLGLPLAMFVGGLAVGLGGLLTDYSAYSSLLRERKDFMAASQPGAPLVGVVNYAKMMLRTKDIVVAPVGRDAVRTRAGVPGRKPVLTIIVAGETARAQNFSLNGYGVETNPELAARDIVNFTDVQSCGTATATSLPCMFSIFGRPDFSFSNGVSNETLLDVLAHAGFAVEWWDNNTGSKAVAARVPTRSFANTDDAQFCGAGECTDGIFLEALADYLPTVTQDTVLVFHQIGSHGPTYHLRYPPEFARFQPACETAELGDCTREQIVNAYDNTILYTDHVLAETIDMLAGQTGLATSMVYVSDHGESLGENGLYLHGSPWFMAPAEQTQVPMVLWMSDTFEAQEGIDPVCVAKESGAALSHDNLFHSVLGMLGVATQAREPELDIFADCGVAPVILARN